MNARLLTTTLIGLSLGCATQGTDLDPGVKTTNNQTVSAETDIARSDSGIMITVEEDDWSGWQAIQRKVTPLHVRVQNNSNNDFVLSYAAFQVLAKDGRRFAAVPPMLMDKEVNTYVGVHDPIQPAWRYNRFRVAPHFGSVYPAVGAYRGRFVGWNRSYYDRYGGYWADVDLPTPKMVERALPEGVIAPGGNVEGVLFFEHVPDSSAGLQLQATFRNASTDKADAAVKIPLVVDDA